MPLETKAACGLPFFIWTLTYPSSCAYYDKKRAEGKKHNQTIRVLVVSSFA